MGAAEQQQFTQYPHRYGDGTLGAAIAQTRDGKDELVTPVALWELDDTSGLYLPPGLSQNPRRPRVDAQLSGSKVTPGQALFSAQPMTINTPSQWVPCSGYNRAVVLVEISGNPGNTSIAIQGRANTHEALLAMYFLNTGVAVTKTGIPAYYELDLNPMQEIRAYIYGTVNSAATVTVTVWFSATVFVPGASGVAIPLFSAVAIRSTSLTNAPVISGYGVARSKLIATNSHDAQLRLVMRHPYGTLPAYSDFSGATLEMVIPAGANRSIITPVDAPFLDGMLPEETTWSVGGLTTPTTGTFSLIWLAEPTA